MTEVTAGRKAVRIRPVYLVVAVMAVLVVVTAGWLMGGALRPYVFHGTLFQSPTPALNFTLTGHNGQAVSLDDYREKVVLLYFGYTTCPDVCPTTLAELHSAVQLLGNRARDVQVMMITVDPERDTLQVLAEYMPHFDANFIGLTGTPEQIAEIATYYGVAYERSAEPSVLGYLVNHTATVAALDRQGYVRVIFPFQTPARDIAADVEYLLNR